MINKFMLNYNVIFMINNFMLNNNVSFMIKIIRICQIESFNLIYLYRLEFIS